MIYWVLKHLLIGPLLKTVYRPWVVGAENLPASGPVIIVGNHALPDGTKVRPVGADEPEEHEESP